MNKQGLTNMDRPVSDRLKGKHLKQKQKITIIFDVLKRK